MQSFDVCDRRLDVHKSWFLEASAGTGKTYSIENLYARFLLQPGLDGEFLGVAQILVVTFTRAATMELKERIRKQLQRLLGLFTKQEQRDAPDYVKAIYEKGQEACLQAHKRLKTALSAFDEAAIFTIHGFCYRMLSEYAFESRWDFHAFDPECGEFRKSASRAVADFLRLQMKEENYSVNQVACLLKAMRQDAKKLEEALVDAMNCEKPLPVFPNFSSLNTEFVHLVQSWPYCIDQGMAEADLALLASNHKGMCNQKKEIKKEIKNSHQVWMDVLLKRTPADEGLNVLLKDGGLWLQNITPSMRKKNFTEGALHYPQLVQDIQKTLLPLVKEAQDPDKIFHRLVLDCKELWSKQNVANVCSFDTLLKEMKNRLQYLGFRKSIKERFACVIIDEFQDTDPLQWEIFSTCFSQQDSRYLYLVGDPKQSIYSFRSADIYTYLSAKKQFRQESHASLQTNYRSQDRLVQALNTLFSSEKMQGMLELPKWSQALSVPVVQATRKKPVWAQKERGSIHFFIAKGKSSHKNWPTPSLEEQELFPFMADEMLKLHKQGIAFEKMAILVRDKFQSARLVNYFKKLQIPHRTMRPKSVFDSPAFEALFDCMQAMKGLPESSLLKKALAGTLFRLEHNHIQHVQNPECEEDFFAIFYALKNLLEQNGIVSFVEKLLQTTLPLHELSLEQNILQQEGGCAYLHELSTLIHLLAEAEKDAPLSVELYVEKMQEMQKKRADESFVVPALQSLGIQILTMHMSKGLEFEVVFALGLSSRTTQDLSLSESVQAQNPLFYHERDAEKMRQLYVAMTRAKERLYVPLVFDQAETILQKGSASAMELFCQRLDPGGVCRQETTLDFLRAVGQSSDITYSFCKDAQPAAYVAAFPTARLAPPPDIALHFKNRTIQSFTSLSKKNQRALSAPHQQKAGELPYGADVGIAIHALLQKIDFSKVAKASSPTDIEEDVHRLLEYDRWKEYVPQLAEIVFHSLQVPLVTPFGTFCLGSLEEGAKVHEMEFLFPDHEGFTKGFIDLFFLKNERYFLLDWKSHYLGGDASCYEAKKIQGVVRDMQYDMQCKIYREALMRYLRVVEKRPFEECFGGIFILFLRGCRSHLPNSGLYYER